MHGFYLPIWLLGIPLILAFIDVIAMRSGSRHPERAHAY